MTSFNINTKWYRCWKTRSTLCVLIWEEHVLMMCISSHVTFFILGYIGYSLCWSLLEYTWHDAHEYQHRTLNLTLDYDDTLPSGSICCSSIYLVFFLGQGKKVLCSHQVGTWWVSWLVQVFYFHGWSENHVYKHPESLGTLSIPL